jgi:hypothetical protein
LTVSVCFWRTGSNVSASILTAIFVAALPLKHPEIVPPATAPIIDCVSAAHQLNFPDGTFIFKKFFEVSET